MFKSMQNTADRAKANAEQRQELSSYKSIYWGLRQIAWNRFKRLYTVPVAKEQGVFQEFVIAPGVRLADGTWSEPEIDWDGYNRCKYQIFLENFHEAVDEPLEVMSIKQLQAAKRKLAKIILQDEEWEPILQELDLRENSAACLFPRLKEINISNYQRRTGGDLSLREDLIADDEF